MPMREIYAMELWDVSYGVEVVVQDVHGILVDMKYIGGDEFKISVESDEEVKTLIVYGYVSVWLGDYIEN